jgi:hypothetical protein
VLRIETGEGDDVPCGCVAPIIEAIADAIPPVLVDDDTVIAGGGDCKTDTVAPGPVTVMVWADIVNVVMKMLVISGWIETTVVPARVNVVGIPGRLVVIVEVIVEAGITTVVPRPVLVSPETVVPGSVIVSPGLVTVVPDRVIVTKDPEIDVVIVLAAWVTKISDVTVIAGSITVVGIVNSDINIEAVVTVEAGSVMVVRDPDIDVVIVEAGCTKVVEIMTVETKELAWNGG